MKRDPAMIAGEMLDLSPEEIAAAMERTRGRQTMEDVKTRVAAARVAARGMCHGQGCSCSIKGPGRWCVAWALYGDMALDAIKALEDAGWLLVPEPLPPPQPGVYYTPPAGITEAVVVVTGQGGGPGTHPGKPAQRPRTGPRTPSDDRA